MNRDIYQTITDRFVEQLKRGTVPWQKPWFGVQNMVSRKQYRGINALLLGSTEFQSPFWVSFKQALDLGGHIKKGEKSTPVIYYKLFDKHDEAGNAIIRGDGHAARVPFIRWANVFNLDQTEGITNERAVRSASVPSQFGCLTFLHPAFRPAPVRNLAPVALICGHCSGRRALRFLAPSAIADAASQRSFPELLGSIRPFSPSSLSPKPQLRTQRKGAGICIDLSTGVLGDKFRDSLRKSSQATGIYHLRARSPESNDRQDSTFPGGKCGRAADAHFPAAPARVRHALE